MRTLAFVGCLVLGVSACVNSRASLSGDRVALASVRRVHVETFPPDTHDVDKLIANELARLGLEVSVGTTLTEDVDAVVTYRDKWRWDLTMYMLALTIKVRRPDDGFPIAEANAVHTSLTRRSPEEMVREVAGSLFGHRSPDE